MAPCCDTPFDVTNAPKLDPEQYGIYMQGQTSTASIARWILKTASSNAKVNYGFQQATRGILTPVTNPARDPSAKDSHRLQGEQATSSKTNRLRPSLYLPLTQDIIGQRPKVDVPNHILQALSDCINFRRMCCSWFTAYDDPAIKRSNESHMAFVKILERIRTLLSLNSRQVVTNAASKASQRPPNVKGENLFENLPAHGQDGEHGHVNNDDSASYWTSQAVKAADPISDDDDTSTKLSKSEYKRICQIHCLLQDAYQLQKHVQHKWRQFREGSLDLITVTSITELALLQIRALERDFCNSTNETGELPHGGLYPDHLGMESIDLNKAQPKNTKIPGGDEEYPEFDLRRFFGLALALVCKRRNHIQRFYLGKDHNRIAKALMWKRYEEDDPSAHVDDTLRPMLLFDDDIEESREWFVAFDDERFEDVCVGCHGKDDTIRDMAYYSKKAHPTGKLLALSKNNHPFIPGFFPGRSKIISRFSVDQERLNALEARFSNFLRPCDRIDICHFGREDAVLAELRVAVATGICGLATAFAVAIVTDIDGIVTSSHRFMSELDQAAEACDRLIGDLIYCDHTDEHLIPSYARKEMDRIWYMPILADELVSVGDHRHYTPLNARRLLQSMPLLCGALCIYLRICTCYKLQYMTDDCDQFRACMMFYNAALVSGALDTPWPDMEHVINLHGCEKLFLGSRPTTLEQSLNIYRLVVNFGVNLGDIYPGRGVARYTPGKGTLTSKEHSLCSLLNCRRTGGRVFEDIRLLLACHGRDCWGAAKFAFGQRISNPDTLSKLTSSKTLISPTQLLDLAESRTVKELRILQDEFDFTRCWRLCRALITTIQKHLEAKGFERAALLDGCSDRAIHTSLTIPLLMYACDQDKHSSCKKTKGSNCTIHIRLLPKDALAAINLSASSMAVREQFQIVVGEFQRFILQHGGDATREAHEDYYIGERDNMTCDRAWVNVGNALMKREYGGGCPHLVRSLWA